LSLEIIEETPRFVLINKAAGELSQADVNQTEESVLSILQGKFSSKVHVLTRLDRPVSGIMILSKSKRFIKHYTDLQEKNEVVKKYIAVVQGKYENESDTLQHFIYHDKKNRKARISEEESQGYKSCELSIRRIKQLDNYTILEIKLTRGKFHQIRASLSHIGFPIKGDVKYGARRKNKDRSIGLHAYKISFKGLDNSIATFQAPLPKNDKLWEVVNESLK